MVCEGTKHAPSYIIQLSNSKSKVTYLISLSFLNESSILFFNIQVDFMRTLEFCTSRVLNIYLLLLWYYLYISFVFSLWFFFFFFPSKKCYWSQRFLEVQLNNILSSNKQHLFCRNNLQWNNNSFYECSKSGSTSECNISPYIVLRTDAWKFLII